MRKIVITLCCLFALAFACHDGSTDVGNKKPVEKPVQDESPAAIAKLIKDLTARDEKVSKSAASSLEKLGIRAIEELLTAFEKGDNDTRHEVAIVLGGIRRAAIAKKETEVAGSLEEILLMALRDSNYHVVSGASAALTHKEPRSKKAIPEYIAILQSDDKPSVSRGAAMSGLRDFGPEGAAAIEVLLDNLAKKKVEKLPKPKKGQDLADAINTSKDYVPGERSAICILLATLGPKDERVAAVLWQALKNRNEDWSVRGGAALGLARMGSKGQAALPDMVYFLNETAKDKKKFFCERHAIMQALGQLRLTKKEIPLVIEVATGDEASSSVPKAAVDALANNASVAGAAWMPLLKMLDEREPFEVRPMYINIVIALGKIEPPADEPKETLAAQLKAIFVRDRIENEVPELRMAAENLLKKLKGR